ncbi:hypothetical protein EON64_13010 [archaeon]|nr:MAG: hypothetical protein EON64_13010 [archaeon]
MSNTKTSLSLVYGEELIIPPMQRILDSSSLQAHVKSRGNIQTDKLLAALQLSHLPPWTVPVNEAARAQLEYLYAGTAL